MPAVKLRRTRLRISSFVIPCLLSSSPIMHRSRRTSPLHTRWLLSASLGVEFSGKSSPNFLIPNRSARRAQRRFFEEIVTTEASAWLFTRAMDRLPLNRETGCCTMRRSTDDCEVSLCTSFS
ncbi:uncharacterized protein PV09_03022 [Verruconis gallopava]|uniref:Uncharacterized protein n=1 Tax=Verruconis gallopava TaxID=253628 RepID=A0A0D1XSW0_9PEZI|nr:uncharacterized protein PV09_03022 [Verruconis gallopava]KIW05816.1 hypothetical protein PV09_03022 [Verruconis gallopava]